MQDTPYPIFDYWRRVVVDPPRVLVELPVEASVEVLVDEPPRTEVVEPVRELLVPVEVVVDVPDVFFVEGVFVVT